ncbi:hypothetical protein HPP92_021488 [Vanilla planifolia]|uniref:Uncharacterized protein n=1 Tax=Vanilla planifolia TaxID=51239 RepID=A0A835UIK5_VANPL|nr:hypothetical protein HPP92_021488 [Vanilla planifolia]
MAIEKCLFLLVSVSFVSILLFLSAISGFTASSVFISRQPGSIYIPRGPHCPPSFAYYISGGRGEGRRMLRLLLSVYHPRNRYLLHLSHDASDGERTALAFAAKLAIPASTEFANVDVVGKAGAMTYMGSSGLAATLHAAAVLLRLDKGWDWFITLSVDDYPLVTQDDLIHVFSSLPRDLNFVDHSSDLDWKESQRVEPIIVDAGIYLSKRSHYFKASVKREMPQSFKFFTGSPWVILSRSFIEYCILGWDNLPRSLLLYFTNVISSQESYFQSVLCNNPGLQNTTINSDLRFVEWNSNPPQVEPRFLNKTHFNKMLESGLPFARKFGGNDAVLDMVDEKILGRRSHGVIPGAWCSAKKSWWANPCSRWKNADAVKPGP